MDLLDEIVKDSLGARAQLLDSKLVGGGCINHGARLNTSDGIFFVKWSHNDPDMFEAEEGGLRLLRQHLSIKVPKTFHTGKIGSNAYLLMEWIEPGLVSNRFWPDFAIGLANLHKVSSDNFGLDHDNYIGSLPQVNTETENWIEFFIEYRLEPQLKRARNSGKVDQRVSDRFGILFEKLDSLIPDEIPALLHGDLWSGNFLTNSDGKAAVIDPAVYFGHREMEISFTQLFGGFNPVFYQVYKEEFPLKPGFDERVDLHNLYPLLVHVNLFGASYLGGIVRTLEKHT